MFASLMIADLQKFILVDTESAFNITYA